MRAARPSPAASLLVSASAAVARVVLDGAASSPRSLSRTDAAAAAAAAAAVRARALPTPLTNKAYLPAQIGGIVGSYAFCLVVVAFTLLLLSKRRREHLETGDEFQYYQQQAAALHTLQLPETIQLQDSIVPYAAKTPAQLSFPAAAPSFDRDREHDPHAGHHHHPYIAPALFVSTSSFRVPGVDPSVDPEVVSADREMAQSQLEEMYKYVMEQEAAKAAGVVLAGPPSPLSPEGGNSSSSNVGAAAAAAAAGADASSKQHRKEASNSSTSMLLRKDKTKPKSLNLSGAKEEQQRSTGSRTSSILSALKSPRKKKMQGISISSPIMTPMSGTFPRAGDGGEELGAISPRHYAYAPAAPPPVPHHPAYHPPLPQQQQQQQQSPRGAPITPDISPLSTLSIDERIGASIVTANLPPRHNRTPSAAANGGASGASGPARSQYAPSEAGGEFDPDSAVSADSSAPLVVGLPSSPKPGVTRFPSLASLPSLPSSPRTATASGFPGGFSGGLGSSSGSFSRPNAPSAVRTGGALPLRAYEPAVTSPSYAAHSQTKQTVFERTLPPLSPSGAHTPWTGAPVPYSPYQPFSPVVPITPSLVTKADRKRMKRLEPKTPTMEMVRSIDDTW